MNRDRQAENKFRYNLKLKDDRFVGLFTENKDGSFAIRDIRRSDFSKLILQNGKEQAPIVFYPHLSKPKDGVYYEFSWILNGERENYVYLFKVDETQPLKEVTPKNLIQRLHDDIMNYPPGAGQKIVKMLDTLKTQLTASGKEIFIYELLQNANDYPATIDKVKQQVDVEFHLTLSSLIFMHSGAVFNEKNIAAICSINDKEKDDNKEAIGYKGIGFKTVFLNNDNVYLQTGDYSFRFDRQATKDIVDTPWQILPIWTEYQELTPAERAIFAQAGEHFRVKFALKPIKSETLRDGAHNYEDMFREIFKNERVILFIPNISSVKVYLNETSTPDIVRSRDNDTWRVDDFNESINPDITDAINNDIDEQGDMGGLKIPTKYYNFRNTKVSFACEVDGRKLKAVKDTCLYCYLPAKDATWGLKFLMNTDMIPNGARDDVEVDFSNSINVNETIANIAGSKLFEWILKLSKTGEYELDSVYDLIPNFASLKSGRLKYKELINAFEEGFVNRVETDDFIPTQDGYILLVDAVVDETGISSAGIMTDEEFLRFSDNESKNLPVFELRGSKSFESFAELYLRKFNAEENIFDLDSLHEMVSRLDFQEWLKVQDNNNKFLNFLVENDYLKEFLDKAIFIEECGYLHSTEELYYDIDEELKDLSAFSNHLCFLSLKTREFFKGNEKWNSVIKGHFAEFDGKNFVNSTLINENWDETTDRLGKWDISFHFFSFLAKNEIVSGRLMDLPFFDDEDTLVNNFNDKFVFTSSILGKERCSAVWLDRVSFAFLSANYDRKTIEYLKENADVRDFEDRIIVDEIILSDDYADDINTSQQEDLETSVDFVRYCYEHKDFFETGSLHNYALNASDCNGDDSFVLSEDHIYFPSNSFDVYSAKEWIDNGWMYCLDVAYLAISSNQEDVKKFLEMVFYVAELDGKRFYHDVVKRNIKEIITNTSGDNDADGKKNYDFIAYLDDNFTLIFEEGKDVELFDEFVLISDESRDISPDETYIYAYDDELKEILNSEWFPADTVYMCSESYGDSKAITAIKVKNYNFSQFFDEVIAKEISAINDTIDNKEASIAFHNFIIERSRSLTDPQKEVMKGVKVYLYGNDEPCNKSGGHKILSKSARELSELGLVEFSDLDIIDPDYKIESNEDYWKNRLGNSQFTVNDFIDWLSHNTKSFYDTITDKDNNINFWRWVKGCGLSGKTLEDLPVLPIYLTTDEYVNSEETIYLSDAYIEEGGLETIVKNYNQEAAFVSRDYRQANEDVEVWKNFWTKLGVRYEMIDILIDTIDNRLSETEDAKLPATLAKYRHKLDEHYGGKLISRLTGLRVIAQDGGFYNLQDTLYVDCEKEEPFPYIEFPNQIKFNTHDERALIKDIIEYTNGDIIETLSQWQQRKVNCYLDMQNRDKESVRNFHYQFIDDLSIIRNADKDSLKEIEGIEGIFILNKNNEFCEASSLTLGSIYNPFFDFEGCGVQRAYVSDEYKHRCSEYVGRLFRTLKVHCDFKEKDVDLLKDRRCATYFWSKYLAKRETSISAILDIVEKKLLDDLQCIPTKDYMKSPKELYYGDEVSRYVKNIEDWENKVPHADLPNIELSDGTMLFSKLPFRRSLRFLDGLYALITVKSQNRRRQILAWMVQDYDKSFDKKVSEYRDDENALWYNNRNELIHIQKLYALNYGEKALEQYFGSNPRIINKDYFPVGNSYTQACKILGIKTISLCDLKMEPIGESVFTQRNTDLKLFALVIAGMIDPDGWQELYDSYVKKLYSLVLHRCKSIMITYKGDESINQALIKFYRKDNDFYFVDSLDSKRVYQRFVAEYAKLLGISEDEIPQAMIEDIMDSRSNALDIVREQNVLMLNEEFKEELDKLIPGIKCELIGNEVVDDENDSTPKRPTFTTSNYKTDNESVSKDDESADNGDIQQTSKDHHNKEDNGEVGNHRDEQPPYKTHTNRPYGTTTSTNAEGRSPYRDMKDWEEKSGKYIPLPPKPFPPEDMRNPGSHGMPRILEVLEPTAAEVDEINRILGEDLSAEQVADQNYLAQLRLYNNLVSRGMDPDESKGDFVRNAHMKKHTIRGGKYIHKCSAAGGIMYLSPSIWNKIEDDQCIVCVYLGAKSNEFMYFNSKDEIFKWIGEDDIIIKLTGEEKADVVKTLYSGILYGVKGTAYTLIRINSNEKYNSLFAQLPTNNDINEMEENEDEY